MSGNIEAYANSLFDFFLTAGSDDCREATDKIISIVDKISNDQIEQWRNTVLPLVREHVKEGRLYSYYGEVALDKIHLTRVIGSALRRAKREGLKV